MLTTDQKGAVAETAIANAALRRGIDVYIPLLGGGRYDLIFDLGSRLIRVQCKWARRRGDVVEVRCYSSRRRASGFLYRSYTGAEVDILAVYCADLDRCFLIPVELFAGRKTVSLRLAATRNKQSLGVRMASAFDFDATLRRLTGP